MATTIIWLPSNLCGQNKTNGRVADKPLFSDPVFDEAVDPDVICNQEKPG